MKELQKLMEHGRNYQTYKLIQDEYRQIRWKGKQEKFAEARRAELTLWNAANRYLHAHLPVLVLYELVGLIISAVLHEFLQFFHALLGGQLSFRAWYLDP